MAMQEERKAADFEVYLIELEVLSGKSLPSKDIDGKSDPFVIIKVAGTEKSTKVIKNNLNPIWNEKFSFKFFANPKQIVFDVDDKDLTSEDDIGTAVLSLDALFNSADRKEMDLPLKKKKKKVIKGASIKIRISAHRLLPFSLQKVIKEQNETIRKQNQKTDQQNQNMKKLKQQNDSTMQKVKQQNNEMMEKQKQQIERLGKQITSMQRENNDLKRSNEELIVRGDDIQHQEPGSNAPPVVVTKRYNKEVMLGYMSVVVAKVLRLIQMVLRIFVYGLPFIGYYVDLLVLFVGSLMRLEVGYYVFNGAITSKRPKKLLKLYEYEGNVECKRVREMLCALDLDCIVYPCPECVAPHQYLSRFRDVAKKLCGKEDALPLLLDENIQDADNQQPLVLLGAERIVSYLMEEYGNNVKRSYLERTRYCLARNKMLLLMYRLVYLGLLRNLPEFGKERKERTVEPKLMLELFSYEASPFCVKVREVLSSLEIPYILKNIGHGSQQKRAEFQERFKEKYPLWRQKLSMIQVPLLVDPNTEKEISESEEIKQYLMKTYCIA